MGRRVGRAHLAKDRPAMVINVNHVSLTPLDREIFDATVPTDHYLRRVLAAISSCRRNTWSSPSSCITASASDTWRMICTGGVPGVSGVGLVTCSRMSVNFQ